MLQLAGKQCKSICFGRLLTINWKSSVFRAERYDVDLHWTTPIFHSNTNFPLQYTTSTQSGLKSSSGLSDAIESFHSAQQRMRIHTKHVDDEWKFKFELYSNICQLLSICDRWNMYCYRSSKCKANNHHNGHTMHIQFQPNWFVRANNFGAQHDTNKLNNNIYMKKKKKKDVKKTIRKTLFSDKTKGNYVNARSLSLNAFAWVVFFLPLIWLQWALKVPENNQITFIWPLNHERLPEI